MNKAYLQLNHEKQLHFYGQKSSAESEKRIEKYFENSKNA